MTDPAHEIIDQVLLELSTKDSAPARKLEKLIARKRPALVALARALLSQQAAAPPAPPVAPPTTAPATADPWASQHRGWKVTPVAGTGGAARVIKGYDVHAPGGGTTFVGSIKDAKKFIDEALGRDSPPVQTTSALAAPPAPRPSSRFDAETLSVWVNEIPAHLDAPLQAIVRDPVSDYVKPAMRLQMLAPALAHGVNEALLQDLPPPVEFNITLPYVRGSLQVVRVEVQLDPGGELRVRTIERQFPGPGSALKPHELDLRAGSARVREDTTTTTQAQAPAPHPTVDPLEVVWAAAKAARSPQQYFWDLLAHEHALPELQERLRQVGEPADLASARSFQEESEREQIAEGLGETGQGRPDQARLEYILGQQREAFRFQNPVLVALAAGVEPQRLPTSQADRDADLQLAQAVIAKAAAMKRSPSAPTHANPEPLAISIKGVPVHLDEPLSAIVREDASEYITPAIRLEKLAQAIGYGIDDAIRAQLSPPVDFNITLPYRRLLERLVRVRLQYVPGGDIQVSLLQEQILRPGDARAHGLDLRSSPGAPAAPPLAEEDDGPDTRTYTEHELLMAILPGRGEDWQARLLECTSDGQILETLSRRCLAGAGEDSRQIGFYHNGYGIQLRVGPKPAQNPVLILNPDRPQDRRELRGAALAAFIRSELAPLQEVQDVPAGGPRGLLAQIAQVQQAGQVAVFIGVSHHLDQDRAQAAGVRLADLLISYPDSDEAAIEIAETQLRTGAVALVAIDAEGAQAVQLRKVLARHGTAVAVGFQELAQDDPAQDVQDVQVQDVPAAAPLQLGPPLDNPFGIPAPHAGRIRDVVGLLYRRGETEGLVWDYRTVSLKLLAGGYERFDEVLVHDFAAPDQIRGLTLEGAQFYPPRAARQRVLEIYDRHIADLEERIIKKTAAPHASSGHKKTLVDELKGLQRDRELVAWMPWDAPEPALPPDVPEDDEDEDAQAEEDDAQAPPDGDDPDTWTSNHLAYQGALLAQRDRAKGRARRLQAYGVGGVATKQRLSDLTPDEQQALMAAYSTAYDAPEPPPEPVRRSLGREDYKARQVARQERLETAADNANAEAEGRFARADQISQRFYMGQPIILNHHSTKGALRDQERMHDSMRAGIAAKDRAAELQSRAAGVGTAGISSDDPDALVELRDKLAKLEKRRDSLKAVNAAYRKGGWEAVALLPKMGMTPERIAEFKATMAATPWEKMPIEAYVLSNLGGNIRTVKQRIENLEKETRRDGMPEIVGHGWRIEEREDLNRIAVSFDKKPSKAVLELLRGWHYSRTETAHLRLNNPNGRGAARYLAEQLAPHYPPPADGDSTKGGF